MVRRLGLALWAALLLSLPGCYRLVHDARGPVPVAMRSGGGGGAGESFYERRKAWWLFGGFLPVEVPRTRDVLAAVGGRAGAVRIDDLRIETKVTVLDGAIAILTGGIVTPMTVTWEGRVVRREGAARRR